MYIQPSTSTPQFALIFLAENLEKYRSPELYDAPLEGPTIFLYRSSTSRTPMDSSTLAELKYAFFSRTGRNTEKLRHWNLFQLTIFKAARHRYVLHFEINHFHAL